MLNFEFIDVEFGYDFVVVFDGNSTTNEIAAITGRSTALIDVILLLDQNDNDKYSPSSRNWSSTTSRCYVRANGRQF